MTAPASERVRVRRRPDRGVYERDVVHAILDEALICHVAFVDDGQPFALPTIHVRVDSTLYLHGARASRMLKLAAAGAPVCVTATIIDGLVLARSAFHHSMNYRAAVVLGVARPVDDLEEKRRASAAIVEHVAAGRSEAVRLPSDKELQATAFVALPIDECSAKVRSGAPIDDDDDLALDVWAGILPLALTAQAPVADPHVAAHLAPPGHVTEWRRP